MSAGKPAANAVWIIGGKILLALLHLGVSMTAARRLGPGGFGEIQYAAAVTGLLLPLCTLGLHDVLIPELVLHPQNSGVALGSALGMRLAASLGVLVLWGFLLQWTGQGEGGSVAFLYGVSLVFQAAEPLGDWFRSRLQSRWPALISCAAAVAAGLCQLGLLLGGAGIRWFALAHGLEAAVAVPLLIWPTPAVPASNPCDGIPPQPGRFGTRGGTFSCPACWWPCTVKRTG